MKEIKSGGLGSAESGNADTMGWRLVRFLVIVGAIGLFVALALQGR